MSNNPIFTGCGVAIVKISRTFRIFDVIIKMLRKMSLWWT